MGPFFVSFFWFRFRSFLAFFRVFAVGCVISFSWCWAPCCSFFRRAFCVRFCLCFLFFSGFFGFLFGSGCWAPRCSLFPSGFLCAFLFVFSLLFVLFWVPGDHGGRGGAEAYDSGLGAHYSGRERLMTADGGLITGAGKACDSGRGGFLCAFRCFFVFFFL